MPETQTHKRRRGYDSHRCAPHLHCHVAWHGTRDFSLGLLRLWNSKKIKLTPFSPFPSHTKTKCVWLLESLHSPMARSSLGGWCSNKKKYYGIIPFSYYYGVHVRRVHRHGLVNLILRNRTGRELRARLVTCFGLVWTPRAFNIKRLTKAAGGGGREMRLSLNKRCAKLSLFRRI